MALRLPDLSHALVADLPRGRLEAVSPAAQGASAPARLVALPAAWLDAVVARLHDDARATGALVDDLAADVTRDARALLDDADDPPPEDVAQAISVAFALRGLGLARFERWGDALAFVWCDPPGRGEAFRDLAAQLAARVVGELMGLEVHGAPVRSDEGEIRVLLGSAAVCAAARALTREGAALGAVLDRLVTVEDRA